MRKFLLLMTIVSFLFGCSEGEHLDDPAFPNVYAKIYREASDPTKVYARDIRLTKQGAYDPELDSGIHDGVVSVDGVACTNAVSPSYQYYSATAIATSPGSTHTLSATIEGVTYTAAVATPGDFTASCPASLKTSDAITVSYAFTDDLPSDKLVAIVSAVDAADSEDHLIDIEPDATGTVVFPAGTLAPGTDRYIQVIVSNTTTVEEASARSYLTVIQSNGVYVTVTE